MPRCTFPYNPKLQGMNIIPAGPVEIDFKMKDKKIQTRVYHNMDKETAYKLFYSKTPLVYFTQNIKNKFIVTVK